MKISAPETTRARVEVSPLIDVVFLLLVVFIYAMLSMAHHRRLPVVLPQSQTAESSSPTELAVIIKSDGTISLNDKPVSLPGLTARLKKDAPQNKKSVALYAADTLSYQRLINVIDAIRIAGISQVALQANITNR